MDEGGREKNARAEVLAVEDDLFLETASGAASWQERDSAGCYGKRQRSDSGRDLCKRRSLFHGDGLRRVRTDGAEDENQDKCANMDGSIVGSAATRAALGSCLVMAAVLFVSPREFGQ